MNANGGRFISFVNNTRVTTISSQYNFYLNLGYMKTEKFGFGLNPMIGMNRSRSSLASSVDNDYLTYGGRANLEVDLPWKMELMTNVNADLRQKIQAFATNTNLVVWNAELSKKVLKKDAGKISFIANDMLDDNKGFNRTISNSFITDDRFQRVSRYFLLRFEWSFNNMGGGDTK